MYVESIHLVIVFSCKILNIVAKVRNKMLTIVAFVLCCVTSHCNMARKTS